MDLNFRLKCRQVFELFSVCIEVFDDSKFGQTLQVRVIKFMLKGLVVQYLQKLSKFIYPVTSKSPEPGARSSGPGNRVRARVVQNFP